MRCPYCVSEIADQALACPHCAHDIYLLKPLQEKIERLEKSVAEHEKSAAALADEVAVLRAERAAPPAAATSDAPKEDAAGGGGYTAALFQALIPALILLLAAHWVMLFMLDVKPLYLRIATILIPMPFGFLLAKHCPDRLWPSAAAGFGMAVLAVLDRKSVV